jgi:Zn-dependent M28 family amino/carboxypeptidase
LPPRKADEEKLQATVDWINKQLHRYAANNAKSKNKIYQQSYQAQEQNFHNIIVDFRPAKTPATDELIIVGAHYDTAHGYPGADDNASGVAALLELSRLLFENPQAITQPIQLVFYTLEEPPFFRTNKMGSFIHADDLKQKQQKVKVMLALDMVGYFSDKKGSQHFPLPLLGLLYPDHSNFIAVVGNYANMSTVRSVKRSFKTATDLPVYSFNAPAFVPGIDFSDHLNFWNRGYPAVLITDTSFNRNLAYHTKQDTPDRLDYVKMAKVVQALFKTVIDYQTN